MINGVSILIGDAITHLKSLPDASVHCCVTSPPYYGLRDYGVAGQIGLEETPEAYVAKLVEVFREVRRVLRDDGTLWLNLGDSYAGSWGNAGGESRGRGKQREIISGSAVKDQAERNGSFVPPGKYGFADIGVKAKDLIGIPWRVAFALQSDGWYLRQDIIWHKPNPMPESVKDRCTKAHEYLFLLAKSKRYWFDSEAMKEPSVYPNDNRKARQKKSDYDSMLGENGQIRAVINPNGAKTYPLRNRRSVWSICPRPYKGAHFAVFPTALVEPCIKAGCPAGGVVLDPFGGSGTTGQVARSLGRNAVLIELNEAYKPLIEKRLGI